MTPSIDYGLTSDVYDYAMGLITKPFEKTMMLSNGKYSLHLEIDEDTYWGLVKLGAEIKTDCETYAENVILGHVETELNRETNN
jgi:hypothetical protein